MRSPVSLGSQKSGNAGVGAMLADYQVVSSATTKVVGPQRVMRIGSSHACSGIALCFFQSVNVTFVCSSTLASLHHTCRACRPVDMVGGMVMVEVLVSFQVHPPPQLKDQLRQQPLCGVSSRCGQRTSLTLPRIMQQPRRMRPAKVDALVAQASLSNLPLPSYSSVVRGRRSRRSVETKFLWKPQIQHFLVSLYISVAKATDH
jgi:hypothetical protein